MVDAAVSIVDAEATKVEGQRGPQHDADTAEKNSALEPSEHGSNADEEKEAGGGLKDFFVSAAVRNADVYILLMLAPPARLPVYRSPRPPPLWHCIHWSDHQWHCTTVDDTGLWLIDKYAQ